jgi:peptidyl-Lys metalloendopeptidase
MLEAKIVPQRTSFGSEQSVRLKVVLTNTGDEDLWVLTRNTPLDEIITDCLTIKRNGKKVEYDGPIVKRAAPTASEYKLIKAGQSVEAEFPVSDAYETSKQGSYEVELKNPIPDARPKVAKLAATLKSATFAPKVHAIEGKASFSMVKGEQKRLTLGAVARNKEAAMKAKKKVAAAASLKAKSEGKKKAANKAQLPPAVSGGNAKQKAAARQAHTDGYTLCVSALNGLANDARYVEWFGTHTTTRFNKCKRNFAAVKKRMESIEFTYNLSGSGCGSGVFAYTFKGTSTIWFCDQFWAAPSKGTDSKAGTVLHEHTHSDASTDDNAYGQTDCRNLAISNPGKAIENADSHEYYAGG